VSNEVEQAVATHLRRFPPGNGPALAAVSGGRDSVALAAALAAALPPGRLRLAHVHHHLRGRDADEDAASVVALAERLAAPCAVLHVDVRAYRAQHRLSTLAAARHARYQVLGCHAAALGAERVYVAHTEDDRLETILLHTLRGTNVYGLVGMRPRTRLDRAALAPPLDVDCPSSWDHLEVERPLLEVSRAATGAFCRARGLPYRDDPSNEDRRYRRVWVRRELLPALERQAPHARRGLLSLSRWAAETVDVLDAAIARYWPMLVEVGERAVRLDTERLAGVDDLLQPYLLRAAVRTLEPSGEIGRAHLDALARLAVTPGRRRRLDLPGGLAAEREGRWLTLARGLGPSTPGPSFELPLPVPGAVPLPDGRVVRAELRDAPERFRQEPGAAWLDAALASQPLRVRPRRPGDRYRPLGAPGSKPLKDVFIDRKLPQAERARALVVLARGVPVWVSGLPVAECARVPAGARRALRLELDESGKRAGGADGG